MVQAGEILEASRWRRRMAPRRTLIDPLRVIESYKYASVASSIYDGFDPLEEEVEEDEPIKNPRRLGNIYEQISHQIPFPSDSGSDGSPDLGSQDRSPASSQASTFSDVDGHRDVTQEIRKRRSPEQSKPRPKNLTLTSTMRRPSEQAKQNDQASVSSPERRGRCRSIEDAPPPPPPKGAGYKPAPHRRNDSEKRRSRSETNLRQLSNAATAGATNRPHHTASDTHATFAESHPRRPGPQRGGTQIALPKQDKRPEKTRNASVPPPKRRQIDEQAALEDREAARGGLSHSQLVPFVLAQTPPAQPREPMELPGAEKTASSHKYSRSASHTRENSHGSNALWPARKDSLRLASPSLVPAPLFPPSFPNLRSIPLQASPRSSSPSQESSRITGKQQLQYSNTTGSDVSPPAASMTSAALKGPLSQPEHVGSRNRSRSNTHSPTPSRPGTARGPPGTRRPSGTSTIQQVASFNCAPSQQSSYASSVFSRQPSGTSSYTGTAFSRQDSQTSGQTISTSQRPYESSTYGEAGRKPSETSVYSNSIFTQQLSQANAHPLSAVSRLTSNTSNNPTRDRSHSSECVSPLTANAVAPPMHRSISQPLSPRRVGRSTSPEPPTTSPRLPVAAPALRSAHYNCYVQHRPLLPSRNLRAPVRCMTCGADAPCMFKCGWCCLRICSACAQILGACKGDLTRLVPPTRDDVAGEELRQRVDDEVAAAAQEIRASHSPNRAHSQRPSDADEGASKSIWGSLRRKRSGMIVQPKPPPPQGPVTPWPSMGTPQASAAPTADASAPVPPPMQRTESSPPRSSPWTDGRRPTLPANPSPFRDPNHQAPRGRQPSQSANPMATLRYPEQSFRSHQGTLLTLRNASLSSDSPQPSRRAHQPSASRSSQFSQSSQLSQSRTIRFAEPAHSRNGSLDRPAHVVAEFTSPPSDKCFGLPDAAARLRRKVSGNKGQGQGPGQGNKMVMF